MTACVVGLRAIGLALAAHYAQRGIATVMVGEPAPAELAPIKPVKLAQPVGTVSSGPAPWSCGACIWKRYASRVNACLLWWSDCRMKNQ